MVGARTISLPITDLGLATEYGLSDPIIKEERRSVLRIEENAKQYALKCVDRKPADLLFQAQVFDFLQQTGFQHYVPIVPTTRGQYFVTCLDATYFLMPWVEGRESSFLAYSDLVACAKTLGKLHRLSQNFRPKGKDWLKTWSTGLQELSKLKKSSFCLSAFIKLVPEAIQAGEKALGLAQDQEVLASLCKPAVVCHHDLTHRNFILAPNNEAILIDFDYAKADVSTRDLAQFLSKALKVNDWNINLAVALLTYYSQENPLSRGDLGALLAFLYFPRSLWGLRDRIKEITSPEDVPPLVRKVQRALAKQDAIDKLSKTLGF